MRSSSSRPSSTARRSRGPRSETLDGGKGKIITAIRAVLLAGTRVDRDLDGPPAAFFRQLPAKVDALLHQDFESGLVGGRDYAVPIDPTAIRDLAGNRFRGIDDDTTWNFRTMRAVAIRRTSSGWSGPAITGITPRKAPADCGRDSRREARFSGGGPATCGRPQPRPSR